ncbi:MAG: hypothetical protein IPO52_15710 [Gemmatimonadetes bacterium]|nr:hypothetical protein [Gemmatimonadota bacterium]
MPECGTELSLVGADIEHRIDLVALEQSDEVFRRHPVGPIDPALLGIDAPHFEEAIRPTGRYVTPVRPSNDFIR